MPATAQPKLAVSLHRLREGKGGPEGLLADLKSAAGLIRRATGNPASLRPGSAAALTAAAQYRPLLFVLNSIPIKMATDVLLATDPKTTDLPSPDPSILNAYLAVNLGRSDLWFESGIHTALTRASIEADKLMKADPFLSEWLDLARQIQHVSNHLGSSQFLTKLPVHVRHRWQVVDIPAAMNVAILADFQKAAESLLRAEDPCRLVSEESLVQTQFNSTMTVMGWAALQIRTFRTSRRELVRPLGSGLRSREVHAHLLQLTDVAGGQKRIDFTPAMKVKLAEARREVVMSGDEAMRREGCMSLQALPGFTKDWRDKEAPQTAAISDLNHWMIKARAAAGLHVDELQPLHERLNAYSRKIGRDQLPAAVVVGAIAAAVETARGFATIRRDGRSLVPAEMGIDLDVSTGLV